VITTDVNRLDAIHKESSSEDCEKVLFDENRGALKFNRGLIARHPLLFLRIISPFLLSHHPFCSNYNSHIFRLRNRTLCLGCFFNTIFFLFSIGILFIIWIIDNSLLNANFLFLLGLVVLFGYIPLTLANRSENQNLKILSKFFLGSSFAMISWSILINNGLFSPGIEYKLSLILLLYLFVVTLLSAKRIIEVGKTCERCEYKMRWSKCPGFRKILCDLIMYSFIYPAMANQ